MCGLYLPLGTYAGVGDVRLVPEKLRCKAVQPKRDPEHVEEGGAQNSKKRPSLRSGGV